MVVVVVLGVSSPSDDRRYEWFSGIRRLLWAQKMGGGGLAILLYAKHFPLLEVDHLFSRRVRTKNTGDFVIKCGRRCDCPSTPQQSNFEPDRSRHTMLRCRSLFPCACWPSSPQLVTSPTPAVTDRHIVACVAVDGHPTW